MATLAASITRARSSGALVAPLASPAYRRYWTGAAVSQAGDHFQTVALAILALDLTGSATSLGVVLAIQAVPRTLFMLVGGVAIDRFRPRTVLLATNVLLALLVGALAGLAGTGARALWQLYGYAALAGTLLAFALPAQHALVPELVPAEQVRSATALQTTTLFLTMFLAAPVAGALVASAGAAPALALDASSFALAAACLWRLDSTRPPRSADATGPFEQLRAGLSATRRAPVLLAAVVSATVYSLGYNGVVLVGLPALARLDLGAGGGGIGVLYGALGAGALLGALGVGATERVPRPGLVAALALSAMGLGLAAVAAAPSLAAAALILFAAGLIRTVCSITYVAIVQAHAPPEVRGRVIALFFLGAVGLAPLSVAAGGVLADAVGPRGVFALGGAVVAAAGAYALSCAAFRRLA